MITTIRSYVHQGRRLLYKLQTEPRVHTAVQIALHLLTGFFLSAASLRGRPQTFALGLVCFDTIFTPSTIALLSFTRTLSTRPVLPLSSPALT